MSDLLTAAQAAERLRLSRRQVHRLVEAGQLTEAHRNPGVTGARLFRLEDVEALAEARNGDTASQAHRTAVAIADHATDGHVVIDSDDLGTVVEAHQSGGAS